MALPSAFPYRDLILLNAFAVVFGTLVIQGLTLKPLMRALDLHDDDPVGREVRAAREAALRSMLVTDPLNAEQIAKRGNSLRVMAEAVRWGKRGARVNTISPRIIITPLAKDELSGPRGPGYRRMSMSLSNVYGTTVDQPAAISLIRSAFASITKIFPNSTGAVTARCPRGVAWIPAAASSNSSASSSMFREIPNSPSDPASGRGGLRESLARLSR